MCFRCYNCYAIFFAHSLQTEGLKRPKSPKAAPDMTAKERVFSECQYFTNQPEKTLKLSTEKGIRTPVPCGTTVSTDCIRPLCHFSGAKILLLISGNYFPPFFLTFIFMPATRFIASLQSCFGCCFLSYQRFFKRSAIGLLQQCGIQFESGPFIENPSPLPVNQWNRSRKTKARAMLRQCNHPHLQRFVAG